MLLGAFSVSVNAKESDPTDYSIYYQSYLSYGGQNYWVGDATFFPYSDSPVSYAKQVTANLSNFNSGFYLYDLMSIGADNGTVLVKQGEKATVTIEDILLASQLHASDGSVHMVYGAGEARITVEFSDKSVRKITDYELVEKREQGIYDLKFNVSPDTDIERIIVYFIRPLNDSWTVDKFNGGIRQFTVENFFGVDSDFKSTYKIRVLQPSEEAGLLSGILGWIENIWDSVTDGFTDMKNGITNIVNKITDLPRLLWEKIETGLKNLFVPDDEYIVSYKDRWDELLADRLGAVYEVVNVTFESWDKINVSDATNTVDMPKVTIPLPEDEEFSFGGFPVKIVPDGFETLVTACKLIVGIVCTIMFVNGLRKRYDEVMGVEQ